ncbi:DUF4214 domain-containing protein [Pseudomonas sp. G.S.17]|uniref:DUF4214 domain-containing protein n=1 Tax=Pseudomonas sp. G.S.17 TaxID=3137451 RepID=UPI00311CC252
MSEYAKLVISVDSTSARKADKDLGALDKSASNLTSGLGKLLGPLVSVATAMAALNKAADVQRQFDVLNSGLITATGSSEKAAVAFKALQTFAQKTPYDLNQAVKGFTQLVNLGLTPSEKALMSYGNTASAMGKDLNQMIEAVADAATGEFERLKEFGIKAKVNGDSIALTFQGVTKKIGNNAAEIEKYLTDLGENQFAGAMELRMKTLDGAVANLGKTWDSTFRLINDAGLGTLMQDSVNSVTDALSELNSQIASGQMETNLSAAASQFTAFGSDATKSLQTLKDWWGSLFDVDQQGGMAASASETANFVSDAFASLPTNIRAMVQIATVEIASYFDRLIAQAVFAKDAIKSAFSDDTVQDAANRYQESLNVTNQAREDSIVSILEERDSALDSFKKQRESALDKRKVFDEGAKADAANTTDRLAQFKVLGDGTKAQSAASKKAATEAEQLAKQQKKALDDLVAQSGIAVSSSNSMADAYLAGADNVRDLTIQQKIEESLLKTGAAAHDKVTDAVNKEADAKDRLDIAQSIAAMRTETTQTLAQATATLQGKTALEAFNIQKSMTVALAGKNIEYGSQEYDLLLQQTKAQLDANKALEQANSVEGIVDRLNPQVKLLRDYTTEQKALSAAIASGTGDTALYQDALAKLGLEYEQNKASATAWGKFTEGAVDRVDDAFADAWKNIDKGFKGFADSLVDGFKQLLAEMAHMAITKPIIMQIGASLGVGGLSAQSSGLFGGSGGMNASNLFDGASKAYSLATSSFGDAVSAGWSAGDGFLGGVQGAFKAGSGSISNGISGLFSGAGSTAGATANGVYQLGSSAAPATVDLISNTVSNSATGAVTGTASGATTAATSGLAASSALMYGIGGAIQGYLKAGVKGAIAGAGGAVAGAYAGAAIGSAVPVIGTAIGAAIGAVLGGLFGSSLFGGDWVTKDQGFQLGVTGGELDSNSFEYQKKKGGLFSSNKKRTRLTAMDPEMQTALDNTYAATLGTVVGLFDSLNVQLNDGVLDGLNVAATQISTKDKTAEQIQTEIAKWFTDLADAAISEVDKVTSAGLSGMTFEGLTAFVNNLYSVNGSLEMIGVKAVDFSVAGGRMIENLVGMAGGIENLNTNMTGFYDGFTTDVQKSSDLLDGVRAQFLAMGLTLPATREAFDAAVKGLDLTSEAERVIFNSMTANAKQASAAYSILEQRAKAAKEAQDALDSNYYTLFTTEAERANDKLSDITAQFAAMGLALPTTNQDFKNMVYAAGQAGESGKKVFDFLKGSAGNASDAIAILAARSKASLDSAFSTLQRSIAAQQKTASDAYNALNTSLNDMLSTASSSVSDLTSVGSDLSSALKALRGDSDEAVRTLRAQAQATLQSALATARAGGSLAGFTGLSDALDTVSDNSTDLYSSLEDFNRDQGRTANVVAELNAINGKQLTAAEKLQESLEDQIDQAKAAYDLQSAQFESEQAFAQAQLDMLNGVNNSTMTVAAAVAAMNSAVVAALSTLPRTGAGSAAQNTPQNNSNAIQTIYKDVLDRDADAGGLAFWSAALQNGTLSYDQVIAAIRDSASTNGQLKVPGYATGGDFGGGMRLVGENGPELEVTGPSRIFNANQTAAMLSGGGDSGATAAEVRALREEIKSNATYMAQLTKAVAQGMDTLVNSGMQIIGTIETKAATA